MNIRTITTRGGGKAEVFQRAAKADKKFALVGVNDGQRLAQVGIEDDFLRTHGKAPRLAVMTGRRFACLFNDVVVIGVHRCSSINEKPNKKSARYPHDA
ncbi:hypothetical protein [Kingella potus]|uniref:hypothetical protein n=1 Tax=Kingella potus TaxID=265175 RepID=UPI001FD426BF|nr:hypothetical protein [Kingella potus]UOP00825.1 hypothetical protein LVJ84_13975 [Kingella potus]